MATSDACCHAGFSVAREVFYVNELCSQVDADAKLAVVSTLSSEMQDFKVEWEAAMFGPSSAEKTSAEHFSKTVAFTLQVSVGGRAGTQCGGVSGHTMDVIYTCVLALTHDHVMC